MSRPPKKHKTIKKSFNKILEALADSSYLNEKEVKKKLKVKKK